MGGARRGSGREERERERMRRAMMMMMLLMHVKTSDRSGESHELGPAEQHLNASPNRSISLSLAAAALGKRPARRPNVMCD